MTYMNKNPRANGVQGVSSQNNPASKPTSRAPIRSDRPAMVAPPKPQDQNFTGQVKGPARANVNAQGGLQNRMQYNKGGLVKSTGKLKTGIAGCGHKKGKK